MNLTLDAGLLLRGSVRRYLQEAKFRNKLDDYHEIKGWLESRFLIRGASTTVKTDLQRWIDRVTE